MKEPKLVGWAACAREIKALRKRVADLEAERQAPAVRPAEQAPRSARA